METNTIKESFHDLINSLDNKSLLNSYYNNLKLDSQETEFLNGEQLNSLKIGLAQSQNKDNLIDNEDIFK